MDWLKSNFEKLVTVLLALVLIASAFLVFQNTSNLKASFEEAKGTGTGSNQLPELEDKMQKIEGGETALSNPANWEINRPLFVARPHILKDGQLIAVTPDESGIMIHSPIPNKWFFDYNLDIQDLGVKDRDPDGDGFTNLDEWEAKSDPTDPESHPPYYTKLRLEAFESKKFRLKFASYSGDTFQINTLDLRQPSQFLKQGDMIKGTDFKIVKFEKKEIENPSTGGVEDKSELTIEDTEKGTTMVLVLNEVANSPDSFALFKYLWDNTTFKVQQDQEFTLKPDEQVKYRLLSVNNENAEVEKLDESKTITIPKL